jgi:hypothetical protein
MAGNVARKAKNGQLGAGWVPVVFVEDCEPCAACGKRVCPTCDEHYDDCECPGPAMECYTYRMHGGQLFAKRVEH